ncbi:MAG: superendonuclease family protein [Gammaproteobacteria bacterium]|nr:superendonuclease family protein [Gammaproteobacteria bacterium]
MLVWDSFQAHKGELIHECVLPRSAHLEYLPPYAPELNPVEYLWAWRYHQGKWQPTALATDARGDLFALSGNGRALYRVVRSGAIDWIDLIKAGLSDTYLTKMYASGFATPDGKTLYIGIGRWLVRVDPNSSAWQPLS